MRGRALRASVLLMPSHRVLIAGGGIAALETLIGLRELAQERVELDVLASDPDLVYRPAAVTTPFSSLRPPRFDLGKIADRLGATLHRGELHDVDLGRNVARTVTGEELPFDTLVVAVGSRPCEGLPGALTFRGAHDAPAFEQVLAQIRDRTVRRLAFAVPGGVSWTLPLYELALLTAAHTRDWEVELELRIFTPEGSPLALFGAKASEAVAAELETNGIDWVKGYPSAIEGPNLRVTPGGLWPVDRVVALPVPTGPHIAGLPCDRDGFLQIDQHGRVWGAGHVYAAGDVTAFTIKQGGIAAQQADAVVLAIAADVGAPVRPQPFRPILRGRLLTGEGSHFLRHAVHGGAGETSTASQSSLWWPPSKIAARWVSAFLANEQLEKGVPDPGDGIDVSVKLDVEEPADDGGDRGAAAAH
jgi:sulfide:quinone oxidoreductase